MKLQRVKKRPLSNRLRILQALIAGLALASPHGATAQTFRTLHSFCSDCPNADGFGLYAGLVALGNKLFGTTQYGGSSGLGTVFAIDTDGNGFTNLYSFTGGTDGGSPGHGFMIVSGSTLYGTTIGSFGALGPGTVFALNTDGTGFTTLYSFTGGGDGALPFGGVVLSNNILYGTASGCNGCLQSGDFGSVFALNPDGSGFTTLYSFSAPLCTPCTNMDGATPFAGVILLGDTLYGTADSGGDAGNGTVFRVSTHGTGFTTLHSFAAGGYISGGYYINSDGANPEGGLAPSGNALYGTTSNGGSSGNGNVFAVNIDGSGFETLHTFSAAPYGTNGDGFHPYVNGGLLLSGNTLYGTTIGGGTWRSGTVFAVNTDGTGFKTLYNFSAMSTNSSGVFTNGDGANPFAGLILLSNVLYGTTTSGGSFGEGTVFSVSLPTAPPQLTILPDGYGGYFIRAQGTPNFTCQLQRAPTLTGPWATSASQTADTSGLILFHDLFPPPARAFYRTLQQ